MCELQPNDTNRKHLRKVIESPPPAFDIDDVDEPVVPPNEQSSNVTANESNRTSRGRVVRVPSRYQDFVRL